jgi:2,3,4,5-tetrahydropyridine-2-carboxylate N-succinyltransferase
MGGQRWAWRPRLRPAPWAGAGSALRSGAGPAVRSTGAGPVRAALRHDRPALRATTFASPAPGSRPYPWASSGRSADATSTGATGASRAAERPASLGSDAPASDAPASGAVVRSDPTPGRASGGHAAAASAGLSGGDRGVACAAMADLAATIDEIWTDRESLAADDTEANAAIGEAIALLDSGEARVAEIGPDGEPVVHQWLKHAILLYFRQSQMSTTELGPFEYADKIPLKTDYAAAGVRVVPGASARYGSFLARGVVMMPSYVNIGAHVGANTMVDTWATVGSCAQIGANVHLSGGVGIGGVLEPPQAAPVMVGDDCLIGSRCIVAEGARVGDGAVLGAGVILTGSIPVIDAETGEELSRGIVPSWCVAVSATRPRTFAGGEFGLPCVLVIKRLAEGERHDKSALNDVLRLHGAAT